MSDPYKVVFVGESGVGKTCILDQFANDVFNENAISTFTAQYIQKTLEFPEGKSLTLDFIDTAVKEKYRPLVKFYFKEARAVILVYDVTNEKSFREVKNYFL